MEALRRALVDKINIFCYGSNTTILAIDPNNWNWGLLSIIIATIFGVVKHLKAIKQSNLDIKLKELELQKKAIEVQEVQARANHQSMMHKFELQELRPGDEISDFTKDSLD